MTTLSAPTIVTRFAPSPTGYLHVGGARTALFNWLLARHAGGKFLLRIEDTDLARSTEGAVHQLLEDLRWLGLDWDNKELVFQSKRLPLYNGIIAKLIEEGKAYNAYETMEEVNEQRRLAEKEKRSFIYRRPILTDQQIRDFKSEGRPYVVRFAMPVNDYRFNDAVLGSNQGVAAQQVQDFVIRKSDGMPTYHFAVVVDDAEMGITHVLRGQEHLLNTVNHIALQEALAYPRPIYGHLPIILNTDKSKMGKRDRDKKVRLASQLWIKNGRGTLETLSAACGSIFSRLDEWIKKDTQQLDFSEQKAVMTVIGLKETDLPEVLVHDFRTSGYLPETLLNFLALLGWNPGGDRERMSVPELVELFSLDGIGKSNASFARDKLLAFNTEASAAADEDRLVRAFRNYLKANPDSPVNTASDADLGKLLTMKKGFRILREVDELTRFFFVADEQIQFDPQAVEKVLKKNETEGLTALREIRRVLGGTAEWTHTAIEAAVKQYCDSTGLPLGKIAQPIRVAITGTTVSPSIFESLEFLGKDRSLRRIDRCLAESS